MKAILGATSNGWLLSHDSGYSYRALIVLSGGRVFFSFVASYTPRVSPVLYLVSDIAISSGDGSSTNPYQLSV